MKIEKDRETTEKRLLTAVGEIVEESGLESLGINAVAQRAGVSKMLIYRYFGSLEDLIAQYIIQRDYWVNIPTEIPGKNELNAFVKDMLDQYFPPKDKQIIHCVINKIAGETLKSRSGIVAQVVPNVFDFSAPPWKKDDYNRDIRERCGINDIVFLQATRICERKGLELAIDTLAEVNRRKSELVGRTLYNGVLFSEENKIWYLLAGMDEDYNYYNRIVKQASEQSVPIKWIGDNVDYSRKVNPQGDKVYSIWDVYTMADFVTYPSLLEGWENQLLEAVFAEKPELIYEYPVYQTDIAERKFDFVSLGDQVFSDADGMKFVSGDTYKKCAESIIQILTDAERYRQIINHNLDIGKKHFSYQQLYDILDGLMSSYC